MIASEQPFNEPRQCLRLGRMTYSAELLAQILTLKGLTRASRRSGQPAKLDKAEASRRLGIPADQVGRYLAGRQPQPAALAKIAEGLELDANFLLGTSKRFAQKTTLQALAHMALDRHAEGRDVSAEELETLRHIADAHPNPPMWASEWEQLGVSLGLAAARLSPTGTAIQRLPRSFQARRVPLREN
jgi:transcriptional regulator with XRE-family HTH domain